MPVQIDRVERSLFGKEKGREEIPLSQEPALLWSADDSVGNFGFPWVHETFASLDADGARVNVTQTQRQSDGLHVAMKPRVVTFGVEQIIDGKPTMVAKFRTPGKPWHSTTYELRK